MLEVSQEQLAQLSEKDREKALGALLRVGKHIRYSSKLAQFGLDAYEWQKDFFNASLDYTVIGSICGNRVGKSEAAAAFVACAALGMWPDWYQGKRWDGPVKMYVCGSTSQQIREAMQEKLFGTQDRNNEEEIGTGFIPKDHIVKYGKGRDGAITSAWIKNVSGRNSYISFYQYSQSDQAVQGAAIDLAVIDEEPPAKFFQQILKRIAIAPNDGKPGVVLCAFTPEHTEEGYLMRQMYKLPTVQKVGMPHKHIEEYNYNVFADDKLKYYCVNAGWPSVTHLDADWQQSQLYGTPTNMHDTIMWGKPLLGGGLVFPIEPEDYWYDPDEKLIDENWTHLIGTDFSYGGKDAAVVVMMAWDKENDVVYLTDLWKGKPEDERDFARQIFRIDPNLPVAFPPDGGRTTGLEGVTNYAARLEDRGVNLLPKPFINPPDIRGKRNNKIEPGLFEMRARMNKKKFLVSKACREFFDEAIEYKYGPDGKPKPRQEDHVMDASRYCIQSLMDGHGEPIRGTSAYFEYYADDDSEDVSSGEQLFG